MAADETGLEAQEVPLGARSAQYLVSSEPDTIANQSELVHERDVQIALHVLQRLGCLGNTNRGCPIHAGIDHGFVHASDSLKRLLVLSSDDLDNRLEGVCAIPRIDSLRRVAELEPCPAHEPAGPFQRRSANVLGHPRVDGRFVDDDAAGAQECPNCRTCAEQGGQIRSMLAIDGGRDSDDDKRRLAQRGRIGSDVERRVGQGISIDLARFVDSSPQAGHALGVQVEANGVGKTARKCERDWQTHVAETDDCNLLVHVACFKQESDQRVAEDLTRAHGSSWESQALDRLSAAR